MLDFSFTKEQIMLRQSVKDFMIKEAPLSFAEEIDQKEDIPDEFWAKIADLGWFGMAIPEEYGGLGGNVIDQAIIMHEMSKYLFVAGFTFILNSCFGGNTIKELGNDAQKRKYLPPLASGKDRWALSLTEPDGGTDILGSTKTTAVPKGDDYIINGQKIFITGAHKADYLVLFARTNMNPEKKSKAFTLFIVDSKSPGITIRKLDKLGMKACPTCEVFYDNVTVPKENIIGEIDNGWAHLTDTLNNERITVAAFCLGYAQGALDYAVDYAKKRKAFGKPLGEIQVVQHYLADVYMDIQMADLMLYKAAWLQANKMPVAIEGTMAKIACSEVGFKASKIGMQVMGGAGFMMEYPMQRFYRDSILFLSGPVANDAGKNLIGMSLGFGKAY